MTFPYMLIMRNCTGGMIWQAYTVENEKEAERLTSTARANGYVVQKQEAGYIDETCPGWRNSEDWQAFITGTPTKKQEQLQQVYDILKTIKRDGPYWLGGYKDWLVCCYSIRSIEDLHGFTPIACWSESSEKCCKQWMVCVKDGKFYIDKLFGTDGARDYGLAPVPIDSINYPPHIFDWIFKTIIPNQKN